MEHMEHMERMKIARDADEKPYLPNAPNLSDSWYNETFNLLFYMRIYHGGLNTVNLYSNYCSTFLI